MSKLQSIFSIYLTLLYHLQENFFYSHIFIIRISGLQSRLLIAVTAGGDDSVGIFIPITKLSQSHLCFFSQYAFWKALRPHPPPDSQLETVPQYHILPSPGKVPRFLLYLLHLILLVIYTLSRRILSEKYYPTFRAMTYHVAAWLCVSSSS